MIVLCFECLLSDLCLSKVWEQFLDIIVNYETEVLKLIYSIYNNL